MTTLRSFSVGDERYYRLEGTDYMGFHNARKRLTERNTALFSFENIETPDDKLFKITRTE